MAEKCTVFFISDSTGITAETLGNSLLMQFDSIDFHCKTIPYINSVSKANEVLKKIEWAPTPILIFSTIVDSKIRETIFRAKALVVDIFDRCLPSVEEALNTKSSPHIGKLHAMKNVKTYDMRINAVQFSLNADDGGSTNHYEMADIILLGISRSGKTPTCLYMALQYGIRAANYPLTESDLLSTNLPEVLKSHQDRLFGLIINPQRLHEIREQRYGKSQYASLEQCEKEIQQSEKIFATANIPYLNSTDFSIEEISTRIMDKIGIKRSK